MCTARDVSSYLNIFSVGESGPRDRIQNLLKEKSTLYQLSYGCCINIYWHLHNISDILFTYVSEDTSLTPDSFMVMQRQLTCEVNAYTDLSLYV